MTDDDFPPLDEPALPPRGGDPLEAEVLAHLDAVLAEEGAALADLAAWERGESLPPPPVDLDGLSSS